MRPASTIASARAPASASKRRRPGRRESASSREMLVCIMSVFALANAAMSMKPIASWSRSVRASYIRRSKTIMHLAIIPSCSRIRMAHAWKSIMFPVADCSSKAPRSVASTAKACRRSTRRIGERGIDECLRLDTQPIAPRRAAAEALDHAEKEEIILRVDPEPGPGRPAPPDGAFALQAAKLCRIERYRKIETEAERSRSDRRPIFVRMARHHGVFDVIGLHQGYGCRRQDAHAIQLSAIQDHLAKAGIVINRRNRSAAA